MVAKSQIKLIKNLQQKKYRNRHGLFVAEGIKTVKELLASDFEVFGIFLTAPNILGDIGDIEEVVQLITETELKRMSGLTNPNKVLGVFRIPETKPIAYEDWVVALDNVRDPGNLGTIIRLCDWFGIRFLVCSPNTVDCYNPKTLQASMGSISRIHIVYTDLEEFLIKSSVPIFGAFMEGENVYRTEMPDIGILVMGNEANGISEETEKLISRKTSIPQFGKKTTESLNVATATAILLNEVRRG